MMGKVSMATYKFYVDEDWNVYAKDSEGYWFSVWGLPSMSPIDSEDVPENIRKLF